MVNSKRLKNKKFVLLKDGSLLLLRMFGYKLIYKNEKK